MQFSIGVEYAFHTLFYMLDAPQGKIFGIRDLAALHSISETYLSKVFTKLRKAGIIRSVSGVKGGYELARSAENISFWDIVEAVEGSAYAFQCAEMRQHNIFAENHEHGEPHAPCLIKVVMMEAEDAMRNYLKEKSLRWLKSQVYDGFSKEQKKKITNWQQS